MQMVATYCRGMLPGVQPLYVLPLSEQETLQVSDSDKAQAHVSWPAECCDQPRPLLSHIKVHAKIKSEPGYVEAGVAAWNDDIVCRNSCLMSMRIHMESILPMSCRSVDLHLEHDHHEGAQSASCLLTLPFGIPS